jgi:peroxiredoxin
MSITTLPDNFETAARFATEHRIPWPILFDSGQVMMSYLKVTPANPKVNFPHLFMIDGNGTIRYDFEGGEELDSISTQIDKILK